MRNVKSSHWKTKIGVLGGGQLARMLVLKGHELGLQMWVLSAHENDPAAQVTRYWNAGNVTDSRSVLKFSRAVDLLIFESEFIAPEVLNALEKDKSCRKKVFPAANLMKVFQDRLSQKESLVREKVPTSPFYVIDSWVDIEKLKNEVELPLVLKARRNGYDGNGTYILKKWNDSGAQVFVERQEFGLIAEHFIPFKRELAVSLAISRNGDIAFLPLVETKQEDYRCLWVKGPATHSKFANLKIKLRNYVKNLKYYGLITFEIFDTGKELMINEIAPRVHNSGHYSMDALSEDQFLIHLKAILGAPLKSPTSHHPGFAMYNLLGRSHKRPKWIFPKQARLHWYGKEENRPGRKIGHINAWGKSPAMALELAKKARKEFEL